MNVSPPISVMCSAYGLMRSKRETKPSNGSVSRAWLKSGTHMMQRWLHGLLRWTE